MSSFDHVHLLFITCRYNLLREDSEGFARLIVALNHLGDASLEPEMVQPLYKEIQVGTRVKGRTGTKSSSAQNPYPFRRCLFSITMYKADVKQRLIDQMDVWGLAMKPVQEYSLSCIVVSRQRVLTVILFHAGADWLL